jgi:NitT/TauT family transport system substrate-binding protein
VPKCRAKHLSAVKYIQASLQGLISVRDHQADCVNLTLKEGPTLPKGHQTWQMNEINKLVWPNATGIGVMNTADFARTAHISQQFGVISKAPKGAYRTDLAKAAVALLRTKGVDVYGKSWKPAVVHLTAGGK